MIHNIYYSFLVNFLITNFTFSKIFLQNNIIIPIKGNFVTKNYKAPQKFLDIPYNGDKADIFNLGVILFNLVTHILPFSLDRDHKQNYCHIRIGDTNQYWKSLPNEIQTYNLSSEVKDLFLRMVAFNENDRPNIEQFLDDQWFDEIRNLDNQQLNQIENTVHNEFIARENELNNLNEEKDYNDDWVFEENH